MIAKNSIHFDNEHLNEEEIETDLLIHNDAELVVENLLGLYQQRLIMRQNLPDEYDFTTNTDVIDSSYNNEMFCNFNGHYSFFDLINNNCNWCCNHPNRRYRFLLPAPLWPSFVSVCHFGIAMYW